MCQPAIKQLECLQCPSKDTTIEKYAHLTTLLKKKISKYEANKKQSDVKSCSKYSAGNKYALPLLLHKLIQRQLSNAIYNLKYQIVGTHYALANYTNSRHLKDPSNICQQQKLDSGQQKMPLSIKRLENIKSNSFRNMNHKDLCKKNFQLTFQKQQLQSKIRYLQLKLEEAKRRQERETTKKRDSLEGLVEEINQKNELIAELKNTIKNLQSKVRKGQKGMTSCMLQEDSESLKRTVFRLQNINDKLNNDLQKLKTDKVSLEQLNRQLNRQNQLLQKEVEQLKEENFDYEQNIINLNILKKELQIMSHKVNCKVQRINKIEQKIGNISKAKTLGSANMFDTILQSKSEKRQAEPTEAATIQGSGSAHDLEIENKLQAIFTFLFNIEDDNYKIATPELFDEEEKQLLNSHKLRFMHHRTNPLPLLPKHKMSLTCLNLFADSAIEALGSDVQNRQHTNNLKFAQLETQRAQLIGKIGELKEMHMHIRSVILTFLKTLEPKSLKKQTADIIALLCDFFQYSEEERLNFQQAKSKKLFGFI